MNHTSRMPLIFIGHGNPMNVLSDNEYVQGWEEMATKIPTPHAIVCLSAHWLTDGTKTTGAEKPELIYDFFGFPNELYQVKYPVAGDLKLAQKIKALNNHINLDFARGLDHGCWTVLKKMFPDGDVPVIQISIDMALSPSEQFELMTTLRELRKEGVLFIGSGNVVHNLNLVNWNNEPYSWAIEFQNLVKELLGNNEIERLIHYKKLGKSADLAIPTDDHYRPLLNTMALIFEDEKPEFFNDNIDLGSVGMLSVIWR